MDVWGWGARALLLRAPCVRRLSSSHIESGRARCDLPLLSVVSAFLHAGVCDMFGVAITLSAIVAAVCDCVVAGRREGFGDPNGLRAELGEGRRDVDRMQWRRAPFLRHVWA